MNMGNFEKSGNLLFWQVCAPNHQVLRIIKNRKCIIDILIFIIFLSDYNMMFEIGTAESLMVSDKELLDLLWSVYVKEKYTSAERAKEIFEPSQVRKRGEIICARSKSDSALAGMIILVLPDSPAKVFATNDEVEIHLLGVSPDFRNKGLAGILVNEVIKKASDLRFHKILLWTQPSMINAQKLYNSLGFARVPERDFSKSDVRFRFYEKNLFHKTL